MKIEKWLVEEIEKGESAIVSTINEADLERYLSKKKIKEIVKNGEMEYLASKLGDALQDCYWDCLEVICEEYKKGEK